MISRALMSWLFPPARLTILMGAIGMLGLCWADEVMFAGGSDRLSGTVISISEAGVMELVSELSPTPILLKNDAVEKVVFSTSAVPQNAGRAMLELTNGDLVAGNVESMDGRNVRFMTAAAGILEVPRTSISSLQLGIEPRKIVYTGPTSMDEWTSDRSDMKNWSFKARSLVATGPAVASKKLVLPENFVLSFTLEWQANQTPNFQVYFADPLKNIGEPSDRYLVRFSAAGLDLKREASEGKRYTDIQVLNRTPDQYPERRLEVTIRVNRKDAKLHLFLNGEPEGIFKDPIRNVPVGNGIALSSTASLGNSQEISHIEIREWDDTRVRHRADAHGNLKVDGLISREDDRWNGQLLEIGKNGVGLVFRFKSDLQNDNLEIPEADVSTVFFARGQAEVKPEDLPASFQLFFSGESRLRVVSCKINPTELSVVHPLLGPLVIDRSHVVALERAGQKPQTKSKP